MKILIFVVASLSYGQIFQATATQGDGSTCTGVQNSGTNVNFTVTCTAIYQGKPTGIYHIFEGGSAQVKVPISHTVQFGDVLCMLGDNPTNFTVSFGNIVGGLPSAPAHSLSYNCVVNIRTPGGVAGNTPGPSGIVTWSALTKRSFWYRLFHP